MPPTIGVADIVGMRVTAEPVLRLKDGDVMGAGEKVGSGQAGDSRPDDGNRRPRARSCAMPWEAEPVAAAGPLARESILSAFV